MVQSVVLSVELVAFIAWLFYAIKINVPVHRLIYRTRIPFYAISKNR